MVWELLLRLPLELLLAELLRARAPPDVLLALFVAPLTLRLREVEPLLRELADCFLEPLDLVLLVAAAVLPVVDLTRADLPLVDLALPDLAPVLPVVFVVILPVVLLAVTLEADEAERLFFVLILLPSPAPLPLMTLASLPNSLAL